MKKIFSLFATMLLACSMWATLPDNPKWEAKALADIADGSTIIIISNSNNATNIALPSTATTSNPVKKACTVSTTDGVTTITPPTGTSLQDLAWTVKKQTSNWKFFQEGSTTVRLYLTGTSSNTALRVGNASSSNDTFVMGDLGKLLKVTTGTRFVGPYDNNGSDWRTYNTENATNYKGAELTFYVLKVAAISEVTIDAPEHTNLTIENADTAVVSGSKYVEGTRIKVTAEPKDPTAYRVAPKVYKTGAESTVVAIDGTDSIIMPNYAITITADETPLYTIGVVVSPEGKASATINDAAAAYVASNAETLTLATAAEDPNYEFVNWTATEGITITDANSANTTATATQAGTITANYKVSETPTIVVSETELDFGTVYVNSTPIAQTFDITGANLSEAVVLALNDGIGYDDDFDFEVTTGSLTPDEDKKVSATVTVTPHTGVAGDYIGQLIASSTGAANKTVDLLLTIEKHPAELSWNTTEATAKIDSVNIFPTLSNPNSLAIEYASNNTDAATINASTGEITLKAAGTTTISATFTETGVYEGQVVSYTLTVEKYYTITWNENGTQLKAQNIQAGEAIAAPSHSATLAGKSFVGWAEGAIDGETDEKPALYTPTVMPAKDVNYYAVFANGHAASQSWDLATSIADGDSIIFSSTAKYTGTMKTAGSLGSNTYMSATVSTFNQDKSHITEVATNTLGFKVKGSEKDGWTLMNGGKYLTVIGAKQIGLEDESSTWGIEFSHDTAYVSQTYSSSEYVMWYNSSANRFNVYTGSQSMVKVSLYKYNVQEETYNSYATNAYYAVTIADAEHGTVVVKNGGVAITSGDKFLEGTTLTVETSADKNYRLTELTANGDDIMTGKSFTIGTEDVTVSATFGLTTGVDNIENGEKAVKVMKNGVLYIIRGEKTYTITGELIR